MLKEKEEPKGKTQQKKLKYTREEGRISQIRPQKSQTI